jgi:hypothetical protein
MLNLAIGAFVVLHGLVHLWFVVLSQRLVAFDAGTRAPAWPGTSWVFSGLIGDPATRALASVLHVLATLALVAGGVGIALRPESWRPTVAGAAVLSSAVIVLFWDGGLETPVDEGVIGLPIDAAILAAQAAPAFADRPSAA